jgi:ATP-binding cassette subfamily B (MDR/TAP) protein 1
MLTFVATYPLQAYLFAKAVSVFTLFPMQRLVNRGNFWALMFAAQAFGVAIAFFVMGWASTIISTVSDPAIHGR